MKIVCNDFISIFYNYISVYMYIFLLLYITSTRLLAPEDSRSLHLSVVAMPQFSMDSEIRKPI